MELSDVQYKSAVRVIFILGLFVQIVDGTIINVAIPTLADEFGVSESAITWTVTGYLLAIAVFIPAAGWLGDRFGMKRMFVTALAIFTIASVLCGMSQSLGQLIAFRVLQGVGTGVMGPIGSAILYRAFPQDERAKVMPTIVSVVVIAPAVGPVLGGLILEYLNWRWIFFVNIPMGIIGVSLGWLWLREFKSGQRVRFDLAGFVLAGAGLALTLFAVAEGPTAGWTSPRVVIALIAGPLLLVAMVVVERRIDNPLLDLSVYRDPMFRALNVVNFFLQIGFMGLIFLMPLYMQSFRGYTALETGLALFPQAIGVMVTSQIAGRLLYKRIGPRKLILIGLVAGFLIGLAFTQVGLDTGLWTIRGLMFARGLAMGLAFIAVQTATYAGISIADTAKATTLYSMQRQASPAFGVAIAGSILGALTSRWAGALPEGPQRMAEELSAYRGALLFTALAIAVAAVAAVALVHDKDAASTLGPGPPRKPDGSSPPAAPGGPPETART